MAASGLGLILTSRAAAAPAAASKKKIKKKDRCKKCPESCSFIFHEAGGAKYCGTGNTTKQDPCKPCTSSSECTEGAYPHCITDFTIISTGERKQIGVCQPYTVGLCSAVFACRT
jgi:hypothetical protein